jgi:hypothetical protein
MNNTPCYKTIWRRWMLLNKHKRKEKETTRVTIFQWMMISFLFFESDWKQDGRHWRNADRGK